MENNTIMKNCGHLQKNNTDVTDVERVVYHMKYKSSVVIVFTVLLVSLALYFSPSLKMDNSENRTLATFHMVLHPETDSVVYHESPVERLDAALSDQFPFREIVVKKYLSVFNFLENHTYDIIRLFFKHQKNQFMLHTIGNYALIEDTGYITIPPETDPMDKRIVNKRVEQLRKIHNNYPDLSMYVYYVTQAYDTEWFNDYIGVPAADHFQEIADAVPNYVKCGHLSYQNLQDYMDIHYKTDHH